MKIVDIIDPNFQGLLERLCKEQLPIKAAVKLSNVVQTVMQALSEYDEIRDSLFMKYGTKTEDGSVILNEDRTVKFTEENLAKFAEEMQAVIQKEVTLNNKLNEEDLPSTVTFNQQEIKALLNIVNLN